MQKKNGGYWLHTMHYSNILVFVASTKEKNQLNASERFQFGKYVRILTKKFYQVRELMTDFPMQYSKSTSKQFFTRTVFYFFFGFNIVCQLLARFLSKEMKTMKNYSDRIKPFFAQIRPSFTLHVRIQLCFLVRINESQSWSKNLLPAKKEWWILVTYHALLKYTSFLGVDKRKKNQLSASEQFQFGKYLRIISKKIYQVRELMTDFPMQDWKSTSKQFFTEQFFFYLNIVCQLPACRLSKEIKTMKNYSDRLKTFFAQIRPPFTCTYLALLFSVNKWKSILVKKTCCLQNKNVGYWLHTMHYSNILVFVASTEEKKIN